MAGIRFIHNYDIVFCEKGANNHKGANPTFDVPDDEVYAEGVDPTQYRIVTEDDLLKVQLFGCTDVGRGQATKIDTIVEGKAEQLKIHGKTPLLVNLVAKEAGTGHTVRVARTFAERMAAHEGAKKHVYRDNSAQRLKTVGIGFNMDAPGAEDRFNTLLNQPANSTLFDDVRAGTKDLTQDQMVTLSQSEEPTYESGARAGVSAPTFGALDAEQQAVLTEMQANISGGVGSFHNMVDGLKAGDLSKASRNVLYNSPGVPTLLATTNAGGVGSGRANNYAASLRWKVLGAPQAAAAEQTTTTTSPPGNTDRTD